MSRLPHIAVAEAEDYGYPRPRHHHLHHTRNGFVASSTHSARSFSPRLPSPPPDHYDESTAVKNMKTRSAAPPSFSSSSPSLHSSSPQHIPGKKRGRLARLGLVAMILFPPFSIVLLVMLPFVAAISVLVMYAIVWLLYYNMAEPQSIADYPLDPRRVWKLFWIAVSSVWGDLQLLPVGISLVRYRYRNTTRSGHHGSLLVDIQYNPLRPENKLDVHIPIEKFEANANSIRIGGRSMENHEARIKGGNTHSSHLRPVVVFVYGGAWSSGSKWMYTLIGARLSQMGYVAVIPDYSLYPKGKIKEMEGDVKLAIQWAYRNCREFGGDPNRLYAMGHSAGGQLVALAVIKDALQRLPSSLIDEAMAQSSMLQRILQENNWARRRHGAQATDSDPSMDILPRLRGVILCSSPFDIGEHYRHEAMRGVEQVSAMGRVMGMDERDAFPRHSPTRILAELMRASTHGIRHRETMMDQQTRHQHMLRQLRNLMPIETLLIHGDDDKTVPMRSTREFFKQLKAIQLGPSVRFKVMEGMGHIEPVLALMPSFAVNDPFTDPLMDEIACFIEGGHQA